MAARKQRRPVSGPLRKAVKESGVTRYQLSQQVGVAESVLSRFVTGKQGITLDTADRLADVLGLEVVAGVSTVQPKQKEKDAMEAHPQPNDAHRLTNEAMPYARAAHDEYFESRRGVWDVGGRRAVVYNNNPWNDDHEGRLRGEELSRLRAAMGAAGFKELGIAYYSGEGAEQWEREGNKEPGYTYAMLVSMPRGKTISTLVDMYRKATWPTN